MECDRDSLSTTSANKDAGSVNQNSDLTFSAQAAGAAFNLGGFTVTKTGSGTVTLSGGYNLTNGAFVLAANAGTLVIQSGSSRDAASSVGMSMGSGSTLRLQVNSNATRTGALVQSGDITLAGGTLNLVQNDTNAASTLTVSGGITLTASSAIIVSNTLTGSGGQNNPTLITGVVKGAGTLTLGSASGNMAPVISGPVQDFGGVLAITQTGGTYTLSGTSSYTGLTTVSAGTLNIAGDRSAATGGWTIGPASASVTTVNFQAGSAVSVASGNTLRVGNNASSGTAEQKLNVAGALYAGRASVVTLNAGAAWAQSGDFTIASFGGYSATVTVNSGAALTYTGANAIALNAANAGTTVGVASLNLAGGTLTTSRSFAFTGAAFAGVSKLSLTSGGTIRLGANVAELTTGAAVNTTTASFTLGAGGGVIDTNGFSTQISQAISGAGALTKTGSGTLILAGANNYAGDLTVAAGTLFADHTSALGAGATVTVDSGGALRVGAGGVTLAADAKLVIHGTLTVGSTGIVNGAGTAVVTTAGTGAYDFSGGTLNLAGLFDSAAAGQYTLIAGGSGVNTDGGVTIAGYNGANAVSFADGVLTLTAVPEPGTYGLLGAGAFAAFALARRCRRKAAPPLESA